MTWQNVMMKTTTFECSEKVSKWARTASGAILFVRKRLLKLLLLLINKTYRLMSCVICSNEVILSHGRTNVRLTDYSAYGWKWQRSSTKMGCASERNSVVDMRVKRKINTLLLVVNSQKAIGFGWKSTQKNYIWLVKFKRKANKTIRHELGKIKINGFHRYFDVHQTNMK